MRPLRHPSPLLTKSSPKADVLSLVTRNKPKNVCVGAMLRVDSNPCDLTSWSPTNAVKTCARSVQQPPVQSGPYLTPLLSSPDQR